MTSQRTIFGAIAALFLITTSSVAVAEDEAPGWGVAIAARVIGERCAGALETAEVTLLSDYIAAQFQKSMESSTHGPAWWADLRDKLEQSYTETYSNPANCTDTAHDEAEDMADAVRDYQERHSD